MSCNSSPDFMTLNFCGTKLHTLIAESAKPTAKRLESSDISADVTLKYDISCNSYIIYLTTTT